MSTISKTVKHLIHMGAYESFEVSVTYTTDLPGGVSKAGVLDEVDQVINDALEPELKEARKHAEDDSYIHGWRS